MGEFRHGSVYNEKTMRNKTAVLASCLMAVSCIRVLAGPPVGLMTDLIEHSDRVWKNGILLQTTVDDVGLEWDNVQCVLIRSRFPHFCWVVTDDRDDVVQTAWRVQVGTSGACLEGGAPDVWDSGMRTGGNSTSVPYGGTALEPDTIYFWRVMTWNNGEPQPWSRIKAFRTAEELSEYGTPSYPLTKEIQPELFPRLEDCDSLVLVDFGKDAFGQLELTLSSSREDTLTVSLGECLKGGCIDRSPGGARRFLRQTLAVRPGRHSYSITVPSGRGNTGRSAVKMPGYIGEVMPFRYCEIDGTDLKSKDIRICRQTVQYPFDDFSSDFSCSDTILQKVWNLCTYSVKATSFAGLYVDGDRERIPYEGDAVINQLSHYCADREYTLARRSHEHLLLHATWPTEWVLLSVRMAWLDYLYTGDDRSLRQFYDVLKAKTLMELFGSDGFLDTSPDNQSREFKESIHLTFGDRLIDLVDWPAGERDGFVMTGTNAVVNAYFYQALDLMSRIASVLGNEADASMFTGRAKKLKRSFNREFFDKKTGIYRDGSATKHSSLHANLFPLAFGLVESRDMKTVTDFVKSRGMACSVYGAQFLLEALYESGEADYALGLMTSESERSWYNMIRSGSTITTEAWGNCFKPNQDWNHAWGSAPGNIVPRKLMGVEPLEPGFARMRIRPQPGSLSEASLRLPTIRGEVRVAFRNDFGRVVLDICTPANTIADVCLPVEENSDRFRLSMNGHEISDYVMENGFLKIHDIGSGKKTFILEYF